MTESTEASRFRDKFAWPVLATLLILGWSSGFVGIRFANQDASAMLLLFWRTLLSGLILLPFALIRGPKIAFSSILYHSLFGVFTVFLYLGGFALAIEQKVPTGLVALIADLLPLAIAILSLPLLGERLSRKQWVGTAIAAIGVVIASINTVSLGTAPVWAYGITVGSMLIFACASIWHRRAKTRQVPLYQSLCIQSLAGSVLFGFCAAAEGRVMPPLTRNFAIGMVWLIVFSTFLAYAIYYKSLTIYPAAKVSAAIFLSPPVTMIWAWLAFSEPLTSTMVSGLTVTLVGVWLSSKTKTLNDHAKPAKGLAP